MKLGSLVYCTSGGKNLFPVFFGKNAKIAVKKFKFLVNEINVAVKDAITFLSFNFRPRVLLESMPIIRSFAVS